MLDPKVLRQQFFRPELWDRLEDQDLAIYCRRDRADWFVPNPAADRLLQNLNDAVLADPTATRFLRRLPGAPPENYQDHPQSLKLSQLKEFWFHLTNRCNQACRHCLFACGPRSRGELDFSTIREAGRQAHALGVRVFALTGGEPTLHPQFTEIVDFLLSLEAAHVVVLSNGLGLETFSAALRRWPENRFHLQLSIDGLQNSHDRVRGAGAFSELSKTLAWLRAETRAATLACCLTRDNYQELNQMIDFAADHGIGNLHLTWYFVQGRGRAEAGAAADELFPAIMAAADHGRRQNLTIDNLEALKSQVFAPPGTIHWAATSAWESLTLAPDGCIYPSPTLVSAPETGFPYDGNLEQAWRQSPALQELRRCHPGMVAEAGNLLLGPGDPDQSYLRARKFGGHDPYWHLQRKLALRLISTAAESGPLLTTPGLRLQMGDLLESCGAHGREALIHNNCLLALAENNSRTVVKEFYRQAAARPRLEILNPVTYAAELMSHIPESARWRGYGCGSPVSEADLRPGETMVDLGCGMGVECFVAARQVKAEGRVIGIDMLEPMLTRARQAAPEVIRNLGYDNLEFRFGYLEELPLSDNSADIVISNCVLNLSSHKRRVFREIMRVLKPGGRILISDVVCLHEPDPAIRNDETLKGECIAGALTLAHLFGLLQESGFTAARSHKLFPYREVDGHIFHSLTFGARKPVENTATPMVAVIARGPFRALQTGGGAWLTPGQVALLPEHETRDYGEELYLLDENGQVGNVEFTLTCDCGVAPELKIIQAESKPASREEASPNPAAPSGKQKSNCMVCGAPLQYFLIEEEHSCHYCGRRINANAVCNNGHFVCDQCHLEDGLAVIKHLCLSTRESSLSRLLQDLRRHPAIPSHGPEHHALIPGIILSAWRNQGGELKDEQIVAGITRGAKLPGGACGFLGVCGAAMGVGTAFSIILQSTPLQAKARRLSQQATHCCLGKIIEHEAARCCQREAWLCLREAARLSQEMLGRRLEAGPAPVCKQFQQNPTCIKQACPLFPRPLPRPA